MWAHAACEHARAEVEEEAAARALLVGPGASELPAPLFPMHRREALARGERSRTDTMHIIVTSVNSLTILLAMGFGSSAFGKPFASTQSGPSWYSSLPVV